MDFEAPDGSQISCREVWTKHGDFDYTTISAYIDGKPYVTRSAQLPEEIDIVEAMSSLEPAPIECIQPLVPPNCTVVEEADSRRYYLKAPSYTYDDCQPGTTFVADCVLNEVTVLERLRQHPHPNIVTYHGSLVRNGRISHVCLQRYPWILTSYIKYLLQIYNVQECRQRVSALQSGLEAAVSHLHSLGLAHNDINVDNACVDESGEVILLDFDSCLPFGERLVKGVAKTDAGVEDGHESGVAISDKENDFWGLNEIEETLWETYLSDEDVR